MMEFLRGIGRFISESNLTLYYWGIMVAGLFSASLMMFFGGLGSNHGGDGGDGGNGDGDGGHGNGHGPVHVSFFSPLFLSAFMTSVGGIGIITLHGFNAAPRVSIALSLGLALVLAYGISYGIITFFVKAQVSGLAVAGEIVGLQAEVLVPVSESETGQIAYATRSGRQTRMARTESGAFPRGTIVQIAKIVGDIAIVKKAE